MFKITGKNLQNEIEKALKNKTLAVKSAVENAFADLAYAAYVEITRKAQEKLHRTRQDYLKGLSFEQTDRNSFLISLEGDWPNAIEDGFPGYDLTSKMLASSAMVNVGSRAGQPWVQKAKDGHKFAHVPLQQRSTGTSDMAGLIQNLQSPDINGKLQKLTKTFKDSSGNPLEGKVASITSKDKRISGLTKYQKIHPNSVQSIYMLYRTVSENGKPWIHPGYSGLHAFEDGERIILEQINKIIQTVE